MRRFTNDDVRTAGKAIAIWAGITSVVIGSLFWQAERANRSSADHPEEESTHVAMGGRP
jgi:hypothetical protein